MEDLIATWRDEDGVLREDDTFLEAIDIAARFRIEPSPWEPDTHAVFVATKTHYLGKTVIIMLR